MAMAMLAEVSIAQRSDSHDANYTTAATVSLTYRLNLQQHIRRGGAQRIHTSDLGC
jgi:hypothetical protein